MMVIMGTSTLPAPSGTTATPRINIHPADRCTWTQFNLPDGRGYAIADAEFFPGDGGAIEILQPRLGYIGKSGRFVEIAQ